MRKKQTWPKLPKRFKTKRINALRSGEYKQGEGALFSKGSDTYCCLGVACVIGGVKKERIAGKDVIIKDLAYSNSNGIPAMIKGCAENAVVCALTVMNDGGERPKRSFKQIANWIEKNL